MTQRKLAYDVSGLKHRLRELADPAFAKSQQRYFREPIETLGVRTAPSWLKIVTS